MANEGGEQRNQETGGRERSTARVLAAAKAAGLAIEIVAMPRSTRTAEEAAAACGCAVGQIVKSLIFARADTGAPVLLLVSGTNRVDQDAVASAIGARLKRMDAESVRRATGFAIGGVAPLGSHAPLPTYIDEDLFAHEAIWAAAGAPNAVFRTTPGALEAACGATAIRVA